MENINCPLCGHIMQPDYEVQIEHAYYGICIVGANGKKVKVKAWVCKNCGKVELYVNVKHKS